MNLGLVRLLFSNLGLNTPHTLRFGRVQTGLFGGSQNGGLPGLFYILLNNTIL